MIRFLDILSFFLSFGSGLVFFLMLHSFLPLRRHRILYVPAFIACNALADCVIYSHDLPGIILPMIAFGCYLIAFHRGKMIERLTAVLVFYPALIAVNFLMTDIGSRLFFGLTKADNPSSGTWSPDTWLLSTAIHTATLLLRLLFWLAVWLIMRRYLQQITSNLTTRMWLILNALMLAPFVAILTMLYSMPEDPWILYPICLTSIFSSFGCMYQAAYICNSVQTAFHAQELEMRQSYYEDRMSDETRVRSIYHDLKNHLLVLGAQAKNNEMIQMSVEGLQQQISDYETYHHTGNEYLDIIIRDKARIAQKKQIDFSAIVFFEDGAFLEPTDISTIFGNAIDNAIEASEKLPEDERLITVKADRIRDFLVISVENRTLSDDSATSDRQSADFHRKNAPAGTVSHGKTTKPDAFLHGFGLPNIRDTAERYGGQLRASMKDGMFILKVVLPMP